MEPAAVQQASAIASQVETVRGTPAFDRAPVAAIGADDFESGRFVAADGTVLVYRLLRPLPLEPDRRYPLVVQFHNSAAIGSDNRLQIERDALARSWALPAVRQRHPAFVLVPQFAVRSADYDDPATPRVAIPGRPLEATVQLIDALATDLPVDRDRVYAAGFSMGGSTAWLVAAARPELFAAAVPVSGIAPARESAARLVGMPLLFLHGDADAENPIDADRQMVAAIARAGGRQVRLREYAGLGHEPPGDLIPGAWWRDWLFANRRGSEAR